MNHGKILGIDFGTSRTVFSMTSTEAKFEPEIVEIDGAPFVETALRLDDAGDIERFGTEAWEQIDEAPERTYYEFKMGIGRSAQQARGDSHADAATPPPRSARELGTAFLRRAREKIERQHFNSAALASSDILTVIGYPAEWNEKQREETLTIAREAGFPNVRGCSEPVGVIYYHHYKGDLSVDTDQIMLVYDFGGGTSDVAVVHTRGSEKLRVRGFGGASNLGGRNFDQAIYDLLVRQSGIDVAELHSKDVITLRRLGRTLKERLTGAILDDRNEVASPVTLHSLRTQKWLQLTTADFQSCCADLIQRFPEPVWDALNRADLAPDDVNISILAGGSARLFYVPGEMEKVLPGKMVLKSLSPGEVVAKGLAIYGCILAGATFSHSKQKAPAASQFGQSDKKEAQEEAVIKMLSPDELEKLSVEELEKQAKAGNVDAQVLLGHKYFQGEGVSEDEVKAAEWFQKAAEQGHVDAQYKLSLMYEFGLGVSESGRQAAKWLRKAAENGCSRAQYDLGKMYYEGRGVSQSNIQAMEWYRKAAEQGHTDAQITLGKLYYLGLDLTFRTMEYKSL